MEKLESEQGKVENKTVRSECPSGEERIAKHLNEAKGYKAKALAAFIVIAASITLYFALLRIDIFLNGISAVLTALSPLIFGFIFAFVLSPYVRFLERNIMKVLRKWTKTRESKLKYRKIARRISILIALFTTISAIVLLLFSFILEFLSSIYILF